jgi:hypothetical protein
MCTIIIVLLLKAPVEHLPITYNLTIMLKQLQTSSNWTFFLCMHTLMGWWGTIYLILDNYTQF